MSPKKHLNKTASAFSSARDGGCVGGDDTDEEMFAEEAPQSSVSRRRERAKARPKEMTEEEMMDLALRLSEQEASIAAVKHQQEEEAMREALKESAMFSQTQPCASPQSQCYHGNADPPPKPPVRRKLAMACRVAGPVEDVTTRPSAEPDPAGAGSHSKRKRKREESGPPPEGPGPPGTQNICWQSSASDYASSQTDPCQLPKTFRSPSLASKLHVQLPRMSQETLNTCRTSGFVLCSQESLTPTQTSLPSPSKSPTFPSSARHSDHIGNSKKVTFPKSTDCSDPVMEEIRATGPRDNCPKSPVFGRVNSTQASDNTDTTPKSPVFGRAESTNALDNTNVPPKSPAFGRVVSSQASDNETQIAVSGISQKFLSTCDAVTSPESLKTKTKLSHSKRRIYSASHTLSKGLTFPKDPAVAGNRPGEDEDVLRRGCSGRTEHCRTSPVFGETSPVFRAESQDSGGTNLPKARSGRSSPVFGGISPVFGRTGAENSGILPATIDGESSREDIQSASSSHGSATYNKETRKPPQCLRKTNGVNQKDAESDSTSREHASKPTTTTLAGKEKQTKSDEDSGQEGVKVTSDMTLRWSDDEEDLTQSGVSPSPVFPGESPLQRAKDQRRPLERRAPAQAGTSSHSLKRLRGPPLPAPAAVKAGGSGPPRTQDPSRPGSAPPERPGGEPLVHYYWGVPFCPQGLDPDVYTQVILAQMEVYEKSLKRAQRGLLRKAEWGDAITPKTEEPLEDSPELIPTVSLSRRALRSGRPPGQKLPEEEGEDEGGKEVGAGPAEDGEEDLDVVGCDMCPETQLSGDDTQDLVMDTDAGRGTQAGSPSLLRVHSLPHSVGGREAGEEHHHAPDLGKNQEEAGDAGGDREQPAVGSPGRQQEPGREEQEEEEEEAEGALHVEERKHTAQPEVAAEAAAEAAAMAASSVDCPICQSAFPASEIVMHAAFCDGEQEVVECAEDRSPVSLRPSKRRVLKSLATEERGDADASGHAKAAQRREKCYICHKLVPLPEYSRHTEACIRRQQAADPSAKGDLLSALETTDARGGPSASNITCTSRDVIDLSDDEGDSEEGTGRPPSGFSVSDSPIRAFRSISEASDCLVDFRRQSAPRQPGQRPRGGRRGGGGRGGRGGVKRKFKRR